MTSLRITFLIACLAGAAGVGHAQSDFWPPEDSRCNSIPVDQLPQCLAEECPGAFKTGKFEPEEFWKCLRTPPSNSQKRCSDAQKDGTFDPEAFWRCLSKRE